MTVEFRRDAAVAVLTLRNPPYNHLGLGTISELGDAFDLADRDPDIRAILLRSEGRVFCAGADLVNANPVAEPLPPGARSPFYVAAARLFGVATPVVAAVQGAAVGAGLGLALVADFRVATPEARFVANFVALGLHPGFGISAVLERVIGRQRAAMMLLTGRRIRGDEAERWGLVDQLVPPDRLDETALALAREIAAGAPLAVASTRRTLRGDLRALVEAATDHELAEQARLMRTEDFAEGVRAVSERRPGRFVGR
ncbi:MULTISPECIES: enoyl-CoA hydratase/isomerase family protein [unclassified Sphingomonas]|uniref:enoyl-CoA hydratase/isomerase family protein n=1 Tax=unclassified Sphingomonas TaxID=196159 RepID=UPI00285FB98F|nr:MULTISPECIES: enoyl-CoA hydratase/isomerase family protein [unclassified Sphingomonas]MDR6114468.1 enoyl-CoA hydratase/carnithine racemase [Sphingomonas sp. SORGH_AS_0789]MDR6148173.1 enoyl-CoA hydratase/carnithine racemase [Sphingomonas sp. SORGH_AS_0742]